MNLHITQKRGIRLPQEYDSQEDPQDQEMTMKGKIPTHVKVGDTHQEIQGEHLREAHPEVQTRQGDRLREAHPEALIHQEDHLREARPEVQIHQEEEVLREDDIPEMMILREMDDTQMIHLREAHPEEEEVDRRSDRQEEEEARLREARPEVRIHLEEEEEEEALPTVRVMTRELDSILRFQEIRGKIHSVMQIAATTVKSSQETLASIH